MNTKPDQAKAEEATTPVVTDSVGTQIAPGSVITYPVRMGSSMWINVAIVQEISLRKAPYSSGSDYPVLKVALLSRGKQGRQTWVLLPNRCTVTPLSEEQARKRFQPKRDVLAEAAERIILPQAS
jgi:hypothetical protein